MSGSESEPARSVSRRRVLTGGAALVAGSAVAGVGARHAEAKPPWAQPATVVEIEYLRRRYGQASDLLGPGSDRPELSLAERRALGREIYQRIFTPDAKISAGGAPPVVGPDAWADAVTRSNGSFASTQHLLGTQIVTVHGDREASMQSYLSALLEVTRGGNVLEVRGTYFDEVRRSPRDGWQIAEMRLVITSVETRTHA